MMIEAIMKVEEDSLGKYSDRLKAAQKEAALAKHEVESGFPVLHAWAVVGLWALLEAAIRNFVAEWLKHKRTAWSADSVQRLKIRLGEYESIPKNQRHSFVVAMLERELAANLKAGVSRFEAMLEPFGLSGTIPDELRRTMYELSQVRNLIAHNAGEVDRRFSESCPWLNAKIGEKFFISNRMFQTYCSASAVYTTVIVCRIGEFFGIDMSEHRDPIF
jgi:hypothetical protein